MICVVVTDASCVSLLKFFNSALAVWVCAEALIYTLVKLTDRIKCFCLSK